MCFNLYQVYKSLVIFCLVLGHDFKTCIRGKRGDLACQIYTFGVREEQRGLNDTHILSNAHSITLYKTNDAMAGPF